MLIRLLGPVEVERSGRRRPVRPPQAALVLAVLALEAGHAVPVDALLARVWGDQVPPGARRTLHTIITRIRHEVVADHGALVHQPGGYVLDAEESAVDVSRFRALVNDAATAPDPAPPLGEALTLWYGDPLAGLAGEWAERTRQRLRDERKDASLAWARAVTGRDAAGAVAVLSPLAEEHPLDELVAAALIEALHAWGRTAEALVHFAHVRRTLADELGVEPGTVLQRLHQRLLRPEAVETVRPVPAQLPVDLPCFTGRAAELGRLTAIAAGAGTTAPACAISGPPGVGKSSLALRWAHLHRRRFPDGQLYADLRTADPDDATVVLTRFLRGLGVREAHIPAEAELQIGLFRSMLATRRILVVLDDARSAEQVRPLLATAPQCFTLITSRAKLSGLAVTNGAHMLQLDVLGDDDAHGLLAARLGERRLAAEPEANRQIIRQCGRLPLALAIVAARLAQHIDLPLAHVATDLSRVDTDLEPFAHNDPAIDLRTVFERSYRDLPEPAARLFRRLGQYPGPYLPMSAVASLGALTPDSARTLSAHLDLTNLVDIRATGRLHLHDLLRVYAAEQARDTDSPATRRAATRRLLDYYLYSACAANSACYPQRETVRLGRPARGVAVERFDGDASALRWFAEESVVLPALLSEASKLGLHQHCWQLTWAFAEFMQRRGLWGQILRAQTVALVAADRLNDRLAQALCHNSLARAHAKLGRDHMAVEHFERALELHGGLDEPGLHAHVHLGLTVSLSRAQPGLELHHSLRALELFRRAGDAIGEARALNNASWWRAQLGHYDEALADCRWAQRLLADAGYAQGEGHAWDSIAYILACKGDFTQAAASYERAAELLHGCDDLHPAAETLSRLGEMHLRAGDVAAALNAWKRAAEFYDALGNVQGDAVRMRMASLERP